MSNPHLVFGSEYTKPKQIQVIVFDEQAVGGVSPGKKHCIRKKVDGNEDAMGHILMPGGGRFLLIADSHFGCGAANHAVTQFGHCLGDLSLPPVERMLVAHYSLDRLISLQGQKTNPPSACTFISLYLEADQLHWCSTGDSHLWLINQEDFQPLNQLQDLFLGDGTLKLMHRALYKWGLIDALTEPEKITSIIALLKQINHQVVANCPDRAGIATLLQRISVISGNKPTFGVDEIVQPWHELHLQLPRFTPDYGSRFRRPGERLFLATDGIDEETSGCSQEQIAKLVASNQPLPQIAQTILKKTLGRSGGNDNLMFLLYHA